MLALLGTTAEQDDEGVSVPAEIDPGAGAEIYAVLGDTGPDALGAGEIALLHPGQGRRHLGRRAGIETIEPLGEWAAALGVDVFPDLDHP